MNSATLLQEALGRPLQVSRSVLQDIDAEDLNKPLVPGTNTIAWLLWHAARQMDVQISDLSGRPPEWSTKDWASRLGLSGVGERDFGLGATKEEVADFRILDADALGEYVAAVTTAAGNYISAAGDLDEIIDASWDPPVSRGVRLISIIDDAVQHAGQAAFVRGALGWDVPRP